MPVEIQAKCWRGSKEGDNLPPYEFMKNVESDMG